MTASAVSLVPVGPIHSERTDWTFDLDVKLQKRIRVGDVDVLPYVWILNVLDRRNVVNVYSATGEPDYSRYLETAEGRFLASDQSPDRNTRNTRGEEFLKRYTLLENDPRNFANPRQVYFGLRVMF